MTGFPKEKVKQAYFLLAVTLLGVSIIYILRDYMGSFLGAATIYILFRHLLHYLTEKKKWPKALTVVMLMILSLLIIVVPIGLVSIMLSSKIQYLVKHFAELTETVKGWNTALSAKFGTNLLSNESINKGATALANMIPSVLSTTLTSLAQIAVLYFLLYFMMMEGRTMEKWVLENAPFKDENTKLLTHELKVQTLSNAIGIPVLIIIQAVVAGIGYWIFGMNDAFFWGVITGFASMIPVIGVAILWIPIAVYMYASGAHGKGIGLAVYCGVLLVNIEHAVRFILLKRIGNTHPLVTFFGILVGLDLFGFMGLIFGPLLISYFMILLTIYQKEYLTPVLGDGVPAGDTGQIILTKDPLPANKAV